MTYYLEITDAEWGGWRMLDKGYKTRKGAERALCSEVTRRAGACYGMFAARPSDVASGGLRPIVYSMDRLTRVVQG